jgi:hypothetical protein
MTKLTAAITTIVFLFSVAADTLGRGGSDPAGAQAPAVPIAAAAATAVTASASPHITVIGADAGDLRVLDDALARFRDNGLELPDLEVHFLDQDDCRGYLGLFQKNFTPWRVLVCSDLDFVATHELAHAWEAANLDDAHRDHYLEARELTDWSDKHIARNQRGEEDAAFIIQQNLMATNPQLTSPPWQDRLAAYQLLTGRPSPLQPTAEPLADVDFEVVADDVYAQIGMGLPT